MSLSPALHEVVEQCGTPTYVYDLSSVRARVEELGALPATILYSPKANPVPPVVRELVEAGCGIDACGAFDLALAAAVGLAAKRVSFCTHALIEVDLKACIEFGAHFVADSVEQLRRYRAHSNAPTGLRVNVGVEAGFHPHVASAGPTSRFGLDMDAAVEVAQREEGGVIGLHCHIGSDVATEEQHLAALDRLLSLAAALPKLRYVNLGGGYRIPFSMDEPPLDLDKLRDGLQDRLFAFAAHSGRALELRIEPGNYLVRGAGYLLVSVIEVRLLPGGRRIVITDGSVSALPGALLYGTRHPVQTLADVEGEPSPAELVGCLMQAGDVLHPDAWLPEVGPGDVLVFGLVGAYSAVRGSTFNGRPLPAEVCLARDGITVVRPRRTATDLLGELTDSAHPSRLLLGSAPD